MSETPTSTARTPSWQRLGGMTLAVFLVVLALLAARVRAGSDPGLAGPARTGAPAQSASPSTAEPGVVVPGQSPPAGGDGFDDQQQLPGAGDGIDDQQSGAGDGQSSPGLEPPTTHAS